MKKNYYGKNQFIVLFYEALFSYCFLTIKHGRMKIIFNSFTYYLIIDFAHNSKTKNDRTAKSKALPISGNPEELFFRIQRWQPS